MPQIYHSNAKTMEFHRRNIQSSHDKNKNLSFLFKVSTQTISKWRNRDFTHDVSSRPHRINYALSELENSIAVSIRKSTWFALDEIYEMMIPINQNISRSSLYRCFKRNAISTVPQEKKEKAQKFKAYQPGYLHVDVTYLPKLDGQKWYLFVAIDRATRLIYYRVYSAKNAKNAEDFFDCCIKFFPFKIEYILTDNGLEFTYRLMKNKKGEHCKKISSFDIKCNENGVEHRLTQPCTPKTNGMVERANGIIKNGTVLNTEYENVQQMNKDLINFLVYYNLYRRHGSLRRELQVKTPFDALNKWFTLHPSIFHTPPDKVKAYLFLLQIHT
ncbi:IS481 family transposase [Bacteroidia bacterium]|nr:IS481 family transposase [Bacteroidia bacterium]